MSKHKALELADWLESLQDCSPASPEAAAELRAMHAREQRQHALIVQMREALRHIAGAAMDITCERTAIRSAALQALAAADQYLGEQA